MRQRFESVECVNTLKGVVLLRREIFLKVTCEKVRFSNCDFCNNFRDYELT